MCFSDSLWYLGQFTWWLATWIQHLVILWLVTHRICTISFDILHYLTLISNYEPTNKSCLWYTLQICKQISCNSFWQSWANLILAWYADSCPPAIRKVMSLPCTTHLLSPWHHHILYDITTSKWHSTCPYYYNCQQWLKCFDNSRHLQIYCTLYIV